MSPARFDNGQLRAVRSGCGNSAASAWSYERHTGFLHSVRRSEWLGARRVRNLNTASRPLELQPTPAGSYVLRCSPSRSAVFVLPEM